MSVIERYRLGTWPDGTIAAFTDGDRAIAGRDMTVLRLVKAEDYDALADQLQGAVSEIREALDLLDPDARKESDITAACEQLERLASRLDGGQ